MSEIEKNNQIIETRAEQLAERIEALVVEARKKIASTVNVTMVYTYFEVGRYIIEDEQGGKTRAEYGKGVLKRVSERLTSNLGKGWSVDTLEKARRFFLAFSKSATPQRILAVGENSATVQRKFVLSWNHTPQVTPSFSTCFPSLTSMIVLSHAFTSISVRASFTSIFRRTNLPTHSSSAHRSIS